MKNQKSPTETARFNAAVQLACAWAVARSKKSRAPTIGRMIDVVESFHEQLSTFDMEARITVRADINQH